MSDWLGWFLDSSQYMPHGMCYLWQPGVLWLNVGADLLIGASYFAIPAVLWYFVRRRRTEIPFWWLPVLFGAFIFLCGGTHFMDIWTVWNPDYRMEGAVKLVTGIVSASTAIALAWVMPHAMQLSTPGALQREVTARTAELAASNAQLTAQIAARERIEANLLERQEMLRLAMRGGRMGAWVRHFADDRVEWGAELEEIFGLPPGAFGGSEAAFLELVHPEDRAAVAGAVEHAVRTRTDYSIEFRFRHASGEWRWMDGRGRAVYDEAGRPRQLFGIGVDITERKHAEAQRELLIHELNHRVKNTLAIVQSLASQTARGAESVREFQEAFGGRLSSLAAAHDLLTQLQWQTVDLETLLRRTLAPHGTGERLELGGPAVRVAANAAVSLSMAVHELATNAVKYGALSSPAGKVRLSWSRPDGDGGARLAIHWVETGGPPVGAPSRRGFGSRLIERLAQELAAEVDLRFEPRGLECRIELAAV